MWWLRWSLMMTAHLVVACSYEVKYFIYDAFPSLWIQHQNFIRLVIVYSIFFLYTYCTPWLSSIDLYIYCVPFIFHPTSSYSLLISFVITAHFSSTVPLLLQTSLLYSVELMPTFFRSRGGSFLQLFYFLGEAFATLLYHTLVSSEMIKRIPIVYIYVCMYLSICLFIFSVRWNIFALRENLYRAWVWVVEFRTNESNCTQPAANDEIIQKYLHITILQRNIVRN